ncbi:NAD(P)-dependent dehydrogenase, short-chain alcohol dehydrogenase family [Mariniphaga anaerophila]|uniref:NAD(P)-dependent dehydrogenase, short-chain alcohol dehydrogenase family n=1 Tax=Mariniphaga anaerophila TaxID=1484053 RepID=A0A1M5BE08_9BACT|nr:3-ketoacyl-ACP reductase [Mariniphaga anaerophila]SHF40749.1 NAD(P)-dependent dehydrogenase, short-chain alcohol dehydrogenase family [Mariniphaga anaerophila]
MRKTALVTGGSRGIGLGIANELANEGFNLVINGVRPENSVQSVLDELSRFGTKVIYVQGDISQKEDRQKVFQTVTNKFGALNVLVNNAGVAPRERKDILEASEEIFDEVLGINLRGPYFLTQLFANQMAGIKKENPDFECCIINVSSISATVASVNRGEYCISKAGIAMATKLWAARLGEFDIPVYEIQPGVIATDMTSGVTEKYNQLFDQGLSIQKRWGMPGDVGKVAAAMATGMLPYSTGQVVMVDGGMTVQRL